MSPRNVLLEKAAELTGYTETALREKIKKKVWPEGRIWFKAPDGRLMINLEEYDEWAEMDRGSPLLLNPVSKSPSTFKGSSAGKGSPSSPPPLT